MNLGAGATQAAPRSSRQAERLAVLPIVTHTPTPPHVAFFRPPMDDSSHKTGPRHPKLIDSPKREPALPIPLHACVDVDEWRGTARRDMGMGRRRECQSACVQPPRIGRERRGKACVAQALK